MAPGSGGATNRMADAATLLERPAGVCDYAWTERDYLLYALSLGFGCDPAGLAYVYERGLQVLPTFPTVIAWITPPTFTSLGVDPLQALHGEQRLELHRGIAGPMSVRVRAGVVRVRDKGAARGATITVQQVVTDLADGAPVATLTTTCFGRREGGCGNAGPDPEPLSSTPPRPADLVHTMPTSATAALLYRLTGDANPLHVDPSVARAAGFDRPILHGLCGFGMTCRAVLEAYPDVSPGMIASHQARFSAPVYPGETLAVDLWRDRDGVSFRARVIERDVVAISRGRCGLRGAPGRPPPA